MFGKNRIADNAFTRVVITILNVFQWNLVCGSEGLGSLSTTMAVVGGMLGATLFPALADKYGRILIIYTTFISLSGCFILASFVPWFTAFVILRFLTGVFSQV